MTWINNHIPYSYTKEVRTRTGYQKIREDPTAGTRRRDRILWLPRAGKGKPSIA